MILITATARRINVKMTEITLLNLISNEGFMLKNEGSIFSNIGMKDLCSK